MASTSGVAIGGSRRPLPQPPGSIRSVYDAAATQQAQDYDDIMAGYDSLIDRSKSGQLNGPAPQYTPISPVANKYLPNYSYSRSADLGNLVGGLQSYADTGGYSGNDISNIRARAVSPIRAAYGNAQRNLERQKVLQGGYAPGHGAALAKFAREQAGLMSDASTNVNAEIARMVAAGKLSGYQALAPVLSGENALQNQISSRNEDARREISSENVQDERNVRDTNLTVQQRIEEQLRQMKDASTAAEMQALSGKSNLYGTTPALTNTFANQVLQNNQQEMQAVQTANAIKNQRAGLGLNLVQSAARTPGTAPRAGRG